ncbi:6528_t:CDS:2, partial [Funneliformis geosporum]
YMKSPTSTSPYSPRSPTKSGSYNGHSKGGKQGSLDGFCNDWTKSNTSPVKSLSDYGRQSSDYKNMRSSKSMQSLQGQGGDKESDLRSVSSMEDNIEKMRSFETLISNNQTMKVSLTPNRLITIETHKRPPKLAPREPVSRDSTSLSNLEKSYDDDDELFGKRKFKKDKESLLEFLKNTSPDDPSGKLKKKDSRVELPRKLGKVIDKLEPFSEGPGSPGSHSRHAPLIPPSSSTSYQSDRIKANINRTLSSSSLASDDQNQSYVSPTTTSSYLAPSLHYSKSFDQTQSNYYNAPSKHKSRPDPLDLLEDDLLYTEDQKKSKRRHQAQDLIDFLSTSPPKETILSSNSSNDSVGNSGKKKEKKLKKLFSRLKKASFTDESTQNLNDQRSSNAGKNSFYTHGSNSTGSTLVNKPARYVKIEIPKIPPKEDNQEQSIFDQVEIQGRHARQVSRASLSGSTRSLQYNPNRSTFSSTGGMTSPTILEKKPSNSKLNSDDYNEYMGTTDRSKQFQKSSNILNIQPTNTSTLSKSGTNNNNTHKFPSPITPQQKSYNSNVNNQILSQEVNKIIPDLSKKQNTQISETSLMSAEMLSINNKNIINEKEVRTKSEEMEIFKESVKNKEVISYDGFLATIIETEISIQEVQEETTFDTCNEEVELEEALIVEWLLGTGLTFKSAMTYIDVMQDYEDEEMEKSDYEDADDTAEFIDDRDIHL